MDMSMTELDWVSECHEAPMYAAGRIMEMQKRIAELEAENANIKTLAQAAVDAVRYQRPEYEKESVDALAAALEVDDES